MSTVYRYCVLAAAAFITASAPAQVTIAPLTTFGGGDGWIAPGDSDTDFLGTGSFERGIAYNPLNNHLYLVSRAGGTNVRILDGTTGVDTGGLNTTGVSGGIFALSKIVVDPVAGTIYGANLRTGTGTGGFKLYSWTSEALAPSVVFDFLPDTAARVGDDLDLIGTGATTQIVAGYGVGGSNAHGYLVVDPTASALNPTLPAFNNVTFTEGAGGTNDGDFRLGITFLGAPDSNSGVVFGTQGASASSSRLTSYAGATDDRSTITGTLFGSVSLTASTERIFDYTEIGGIGLLATLDTSSNLVRLYDATNAAAPSLLTSLTTTTGAPVGNSNFGGDVRFGEFGINEADLPTVTLYAMNTNNGIQAFLVTVPEPSTALLFCTATLAFASRRRRYQA